MNIEKIYVRINSHAEVVKLSSKQLGEFDLLGNCSLFDLVIPFSNRSLVFLFATVIFVIKNKFKKYMYMIFV
jgi:hypothetical protein